jgi:hypothetical protein
VPPGVCAGCPDTGEEGDGRGEEDGPAAVGGVSANDDDG